MIFLYNKRTKFNTKNKSCHTKIKSNAYIGQLIIDGMYRSSLDDDLDNVAREFVSSVRSDIKIAAFDIAGTAAHTIMLYKSKIISKSDTIKILTTLKELKQEGIDASIISKKAEDWHEVLEGYITDTVGDDTGGKIQTGRSRNDQVVTAIKMKLRHDTTIIQTFTLQLIEVLLELATDNKETIVPLYTHLQHAQVGVLSHYFMAYVDVLFRDYERFSSLYKRLDTNPLGSGPVGGTNIPIDRDVTTNILEFSDIQENSLDATSSRDYMSEFASCVAIMMVNLSRMAEDFVIWSSSEFSFITIKDALTSPSSIMPQKKNPDVLELIRGKAASTIGYLTSVLTIQKGLATGYGRDLQETKEAVWSASSSAQGALQAMFLILINLNIDKHRMFKSAKTGHLLALDVAEKLVEKNIPFRQAHMEVGALVSVARSQDKELIDLTHEEIASTTTLDAKIILNIFNQCTTRESAYKRRSMGSTSTKEQSRMIQDRRKELESAFLQVKLDKDHPADALYKIWNKIDDIIEQIKKNSEK